MYEGSRQYSHHNAEMKGSFSEVKQFATQDTSHHSGANALQHGSIFWAQILQFVTA